MNGQPKLTPEEVELLADKFVERLFERLKDERVVDEVTDVWGRHFDRHLGRSIRRGFYLVLIALFAFVGIKLDAFVAFFKS